jgi:hypothetical protein
MKSTKFAEVNILAKSPNKGYTMGKRKINGCLAAKPPCSPQNKGAEGCC